MSEDTKARSQGRRSSSVSEDTSNTRSQGKRADLSVSEDTQARSQGRRSSSVSQDTSIPVPRVKVLILVSEDTGKSCDQA